jgi:hypothetical protein
MNTSKELVGYSLATIECMARELFRQRPDVKPDPPIRLEWLIENYRPGEVALVIEMGLRSKHKVEGGIWREEGSRNQAVFVDYGVYIGPWPEYNAVLGEEFAHLMIHPSLLIQIDSAEDFIALQGRPEWEMWERDARRYSRAIRMPAGAFTSEAEELYASVVAEHGFADAGVIEKRVRNGLCQKFRVPADDAIRRMLSHPCELTRRIHASVLAYERTLLPASTTLSPSRAFQPLLRGFDLD